MPHDQPVVAVRTDDDHCFDLIHVPCPEPVGSLLFMPGMGISARHYIGFAQALADRGIEVFIHEWRGLGSSNLRAGRKINWGYRELLEQDLAAAVTAAGAASGQDKLLMGGHSLGAQLACLAAARQPERLAGLVVVAGGAPYWRVYPLGMQLVLGPAFFLMPAIASTVGHYPGKRLGFAGREARGVIEDWTRTGRSGRYQPPTIETDLEAAMASLDVPVLGLRMHDDRFVPAGSLDWLMGKLSGCAVRQETIAADQLPGQAQADHYAWMKSPAGVAERIGGFVAANSLAENRLTDNRLTENPMPDQPLAAKSPDQRGGS